MIQCISIDSFPWTYCNFSVNTTAHFTESVNSLKLFLDKHKPILLEFSKHTHTHTFTHKMPISNGLDFCHVHCTLERTVAQHSCYVDTSLQLS